MSSIAKSKCSFCKITFSSEWNKNEYDKVVCISCSELFRPTNYDDYSEGYRSSYNKTATDTSSTKKDIGECSYNTRKRKSAKSPKSSKQKRRSKGSKSKGRGRDSNSDKACFEAPRAVSVPVPSQSFYYGGVFYQAGDIVSAVSTDDTVCYAQLKLLYQDQYSEKSAVVTWLYPTVLSSKEKFDPATYLIGLEEDFPRKMEGFEFVCRTPSNYYKCDGLLPFKPIPETPKFGFEWTSKGPRRIILPPKKVVSDKQSVSFCPKKPQKKVCTTSETFLPFIQYYEKQKALQKAKLQAKQKAKRA